MPPAIADPNSIETGIRSILSRLREQSDLDTAHVLASAMNTYYSAMLRFRGNTAFGPEDITALFDIWQALLNVARTKVQNFAPVSKSELLAESQNQPLEISDEHH